MTWAWIVVGAIAVIAAINVGVVAVVAAIGKQPRRFPVNPKQVRLASIGWLLVLAVPVLGIVIAAVHTLIASVTK